MLERIVDIGLTLTRAAVAGTFLLGASAAAHEALKPSYSCEVNLATLSLAQQRESGKLLDRQNDTMINIIDRASEKLGASISKRYSILPNRLIGMDKSGNYIVNTDDPRQILKLNCRRMGPADGALARLQVGKTDNFKFIPWGNSEKPGSFNSDGTLVVYTLPQ